MKWLGIIIFFCKKRNIQKCHYNNQTKQKNCANIQIFVILYRNKIYFLTNQTRYGIISLKDTKKGGININKKTDSILKLTALVFGIQGIKGFNPSVSYSSKWISWTTNFGLLTCLYCAKQNGKIYDKKCPPTPKPEVHPNCHCVLDEMLSILAGTATIDGTSGADYYFKQYNKLPDNYVSKKYAISHGWNKIKGNLQEVLSNAVIGGEIYRNIDKRLPQAEGRMWYEADINYTGGYRNSHRILYSNDGLIFVTYDHYMHFYPIE